LIPDVDAAQFPPVRLPAGRQGITLGSVSAEPRVGRSGSPVAPTAAPRLAARLGRLMWRLVAAVGLLASLALATGCTSVANAGGQPSNGDRELIDDVAARLGTAATLTYTAVYIIGAETGTIAQALIPPRTVYRYPTGMTLIEEGGNIVCGPVKGTMTCTRHASAAATNAAVSKGGMVRPEAVIAMLASAAQDADVIVSETDTTIAGTSATCLTISPGSDTANQFHVCVTNDGLLGAFQGTSGGTAVDITLDHYDMSTVAGVFNLPPDAKIVGAGP
jgi:hypothetical protein